MAAGEGRVLRSWNIPALSSEPCSFQMAYGLKDNPVHFKIRPCSILSKTMSVNLHLHPSVGSALLGLFTAHLHTSYRGSLAHTLLVCMQERFIPETLLTGKEGQQEETLMGKHQSDSGKDLRSSHRQAPISLKIHYEGREQCQMHGSFNTGSIFTANAMQKPRCSIAIYSLHVLVTSYLLT